MKNLFFFSFSRHLPRDRQYWETNLVWSDSTSALSTRQCKRELHNVCIFFFLLRSALSRVRALNGSQVHSETGPWRQTLAPLFLI